MDKEIRREDLTDFNYAIPPVEVQQKYGGAIGWIAAKMRAAELFPEEFIWTTLGELLNEKNNKRKSD